MATLTFKPSAIPTLVSSFLAGQKISFCFGTEEKPFAGKQCHVYVVRGDDGRKWGVRVPIPTALQGISKESISGFVRGEAEMLQRIEKSGFEKMPKLLGWDGGFDNVIGFAYLVSSWIDGRPAEWTDTVPADRGVRDNFLRQLAGIQLELAECTQRPATSTTTIHLTKAIDRQILRVANNQLPGLNIKDYLFLRSMVPRIVHENMENAPWIITHDDLMPCNIIVDEEYNIKGLVDWGYAKFSPLQFAASFPRILANEIPDDLDTPLPENTAVFSKEFLQISPTLKADREVYISSLSTKSSLWVPFIAASLSTPDVDWRCMMWKSTMSKGEHKWMVERDWLIPGLPSDVGVGFVSKGELE